MGSLKDWIVRLAGRGARREKVLVDLLGTHFQVKHRLDWELSEEAPHFYDFRSGVFALGFGDAPPSSHTLDRAAMARDTFADGDRVLDIGCGDGFFTRRFYSDRAGRIDAIDVEDSAIAHAGRYHAHPKINYVKCDAVAEPFPADAYDAVIWNGALGHFSEADTTIVLKKIRACLTASGVFAGSESLGVEGHDHHQYFSRRSRGTKALYALLPVCRDADRQLHDWTAAKFCTPRVVLALLRQPGIPYAGCLELGRRAAE